MKRMMAALGCAFLMVTAAAAQTAPMGKMDKDKMGKDTTSKDTMGKSMAVTGCVAAGSESGRYMLNNGIMAGETTGKSYDLMGGDLKAHVGHQVEITGTMADGKAMGQDKMMSKEKMEHADGDEHKMGKDKMAKDTMGKTAERSALSVKSVKMVAATCP